MRFHQAWCIALLCVLLLSACGGTTTAPTTARPSTAASTAGRTRQQPNTDGAQSDPYTQQNPGERAPTTGSASSNAQASTAAQAESGVAGDVARHPRAPVPPAEPYDTTTFRNYGVNDWTDADRDPQSTFAMDVDTASYGVMRRFVNDGYLPDPDSVRVEEYLNAFDYAYPQPQDDSAFAIYTEAAPSPFDERHDLLQIGIQGRAIAEEDRPPASLTFVIDVSGSMAREERLETVKQALSLLVEQLRPDDSIGIVIYGDSAESILPPTSGADKDRILAAIDELEPGGSTNVEAGLDIGFEQADESFVRGINQILLCSDGVANNGVTDPEALLEKYERYTTRGIKLTTFGFGMGNYNDVLLEQLADAGNGMYAYIDSLAQARRVFVDQLGGTLQLIARDARVQVEFNPDVVRRYRLIGYENRDVADRDFRNDATDAGEIGSGHSVTAIYAVERVADAAGPVVTVRLRYHRPNNSAVIEMQQELAAADLRPERQASPRFVLATAVAQYAELLRHSPYVEGSLRDLVPYADDAAQLIESEQAEEFADLVRRAARIE